MPMRYCQEVCRRGEYTWMHDVTDMSYELYHSGKGLLMTVSEEYAEDNREDGETLAAFLWSAFGECLTAHFTTRDGFAERALLTRVFNL